METITGSVIGRICSPQKRGSTQGKNLGMPSNLSRSLTAEFNWLGDQKVLHMKGWHWYWNLRCLYHEVKEREVVRIGWKEELRPYQIRTCLVTRQNLPPRTSSWMIPSSNTNKWNFCSIKDSVKSNIILADGAACVSAYLLLIGTAATGHS
jgi:hypothetical protein